MFPGRPIKVVKHQQRRFDQFREASRQGRPSFACHEPSQFGQKIAKALDDCEAAGDESLGHVARKGGLAGALATDNPQTARVSLVFYRSANVSYGRFGWRGDRYERC